MYVKISTKVKYSDLDLCLNRYLDLMNNRSAGRIEMLYSIFYCIAAFMKTIALLIPQKTLWLRTMLGAVFMSILIAI